MSVEVTLWSPALYRFGRAGDLFGVISIPGLDSGVLQGLSLCGWSLVDTCVTTTARQTLGRPSSVNPATKGPKD